MNKLFLYNTLTRKKEEFEPIKGKTVGLYTCGPTVYNYAHIGNFRTYIFEDILRRTLEYNSYKVKQVMNITDVGHLTSDADIGEDKLEKGAKREGKSVREIAEFYTKEFKQNLKDLNILEPQTWMKATDYIKQQIKFVEKLEKKGLTYKITDGIYFDTSKYPDYAKLAKLNVAGQEEGARVEVNKEKKNPTDFALWKFSPANSKREMEWKSPWGTGFPGWHLECSTMSIDKLGKKFDIHAGGIDHIPIHHTNERAQNWGLTGDEVVKYWIHGEFLVIDKERMGKSEDNFITLQTLKDEGFDPLAYRYLNLQTHYRQKLNFSWEALEAAQNGLDNLYKDVAKYFLPAYLKENLKNSKNFPSKNLAYEYKKFFVGNINNDLNIPRALSDLQGVVNGHLNIEDKLKLIKEFDQVFGLNIIKEANKISRKDKKIKIPDEIIDLAEERLKARQEKNWQMADKIREDIEKQGYTIKDISDTNYSIRIKE